MTNTSIHSAHRTRWSRDEIGEYHDGHGNLIVREPGGWQVYLAKAITKPHGRPWRTLDAAKAAVDIILQRTTGGSSDAEPIDVLLRADRRAAEIRASLWGDGVRCGPTVLRGAPSHTGAYLLQALEEQGWTLAPKPAPAPDGAPSSVFVALREDGTIAGTARFDYRPSEGWTVHEYVAAPAPDEGQDPSRDLANVNEAYRLEREENARLRAALTGIAETSPQRQPGRTWVHWRQQARKALEGGEQHEPTSDGLRLFRALGTSPKFREPIALGGLRHAQKHAAADARQALREGWTEAWVEEATWRRIDVPGSINADGGETHGA